jgi:hypothetical protein
MFRIVSIFIRGGIEIYPLEKEPYPVPKVKQYHDTHGFIDGTLVAPGMPSSPQNIMTASFLFKLKLKSSIIPSI